MSEIRWVLSAGLMVSSIVLFAHDIVADAIWFGVMALLIRPKGDV